MPADVDPVRLAEDLRAVVGQLVRAARQVDQLPPADAAVLGVLDRDGPHTTAQLARLRRVRHQSMARITRRLVEGGLVATVPHDVDRRMVSLRITPAGRRVLNAQRANRADWLAAAITSKLSETQRRQLARCVPLLTRLAEADR